MPKDHFDGHMIGLVAPGVGGLDVTPSDSADLAFLPRGITCQGDGNIRLQWADGTVSNHSIATGGILSMRPFRIHATGTTATGIAIVR